MKGPVKNRLMVLCQMAWEFYAEIPEITLTQAEMDEITGTKGSTISKYLNPVTARMIDVRLGEAPMTEEERKTRFAVLEAEYKVVRAAYADYLSTLPTSGSFPHCDEFVLHAPGECVYCDRHPDWQDARIRYHIAFTGRGTGKASNLRPCPSEVLRPVEKINRWPGNQARIDEPYTGPCPVA